MATRPRETGCARARLYDRTRSTRSSAPPARASTTSAASAPSARCRTSTTCCSWARASPAIRSRATGSAATPTSRWARGSRRSRCELEIPITIAGMSFGALSAPGQGGAGPGRQRGRHVDHDRRRRDDARGARPLRRPGLPAAAQPLRDEPRRPAARRRDRGGRRPGREAGRRRHAARPQDLRPRRRDAQPADRHRPAQRLPAPGLDRPGRPGDQDRRAARDHRLGEADLHQGRRDAHLLRRRSWRSRRART